MKEWAEWGFPSLVSRHRGALNQILDVIVNHYEAIAKSQKIDDNLKSEICQVEAKWGIKMFYFEGKIEVSHQGQCLFSLNPHRKHHCKINWQNEARSILSEEHADIQIGRHGFEMFEFAADDEITFEDISRQDCEHMIVNLADALDRRDNFIRSTLPNLKKSACHIVFVDRLLICQEATTRRHGTFDDKIEEYRGRLKEMRYLKIGKAKSSSWKIGNVLLSKYSKFGTLSNEIYVEGAITEALSVVLRGKDVSNLVDGHPCSNSGLKIINIETEGNKLRVDLDNLETSQLIPVRLP